MIKRILSILLCLVLMLSILTACSKEQAMDVLDSVVEGADSLTRGIKDKMNAEENEALAQVRQQADARRRDILESPDEIVESDTFIKGETYTGTAYYVSNNGSDSNSGRSPESAFATLAPFEYVSLYPGDAVFFERGSVWRAMEMPWPMIETEGLTFSAYGEGAKPCFYGSPENGSGADKWELYYSDAEGKKVWKYYQDMTEIGSVVLNGTDIVRRDLPWWDGSVYQEMDEVHFDIKNEVYDVTLHLPDMWCFPAHDYTQPMDWDDSSSVYEGWNDYGMVYRTAPLYFRCDAGNPGELYEQIEFIAPVTLCPDAGKEHVFDNLCIMYSQRGISAQGEMSGLLVQNCEFGWIGGLVYDYLDTGTREEQIKYSVCPSLRSGAALEVNTNDVQLRNNYIHHAFTSGIVSRIHEGENGIENMLLCGNLIERCSKAVVFSNEYDSSQAELIFRNILVEDNIVLESGEDNFTGSVREASHNSMAFQMEGPLCANENFVVRNNVFALSKGMLIALYHFSEEYSRIFDGNTYIHNEGDNPIFQAHGLWIMDAESDLYHMKMEKETVEYYMGDMNAQCHIIKY